MTKLELGAVNEVFGYLLNHDRTRGWSNLDNCLYSLSHIDDAQLNKEVGVQLVLHEKKLPKCILDHNHAVGKCLAVTTMAAARAIHKDFSDKFSECERYILENYLALAHLEKAN